MTKSLFKTQSVTNKQKHPTVVSHAAVQRRISTKLCMKIEAVRAIFALPLDFFPIRPVVSELGDSEILWGNASLRFFAHKFLIY